MVKNNIKNESKPPLMRDLVMAGFPSPAEQYVEQALDLNDLLVKHPAGTFFVRAAGDSMRDAGILPGDILVVDRTLEAIPGNIVIASVNGDFTVKYLRKTAQGIMLEAANPEYENITFSKGSELELFGVVSSVVRQLDKR